MMQNEFDEFSQLLADTAGYYRQNLSPATVRIYWAALHRYDLATVRSLLDGHIKTAKFMPTVSELLDVLRELDGRPSPEEAWSDVARSLNDEGVTIVWTEEMAAAFGVALGLQNDKIAARMAFKESYVKAVKEARRLGKPVKWMPSLGHDAMGRDGPLLKAVSDGKLLPVHIRQFLSGPEPIAEMKRLASFATEKTLLPQKPGEDFDEAA